MPTIDYRNELNARVPGTTTIIGRFKESGGLIGWAYKTGREHGDLAARGLPAPKSLYEVTDKACDIGTLAHQLVECHIQNKLLPIEAASNENAMKAFGAYLEWEQGSKVQIEKTEINLVSEEHQYGGCPDAIGKINGRWVLLDWKTSNAVYTDHLIQMAAYGHLIYECLQIDVQGYHLCRFSKENVDFGHHFFDQLDNEWESFKLMRRLYDLDKITKKRVG